MIGESHAAVTAGLSSAGAAVWIRKRIHDRHLNGATPQTLKTRIRNRSPEALAGLTFTGVATAMAFSFDQIEMKLLSGDMGSHHDLHTAPFIGTVMTAAKVLKRASQRVGQWLSDRLNISERSREIGESLYDLGSWVVDGSVAGLAAHILQDLPGSGSGNSAVTLLKPLSNRQFNFGWWSNGDLIPGRVALYGGGLLTAVSWSAVAAYLTTPAPPAQIAKSNLDDMRSAIETETLLETLQHQFRTFQHRINDWTDAGIDLTEAFSTAQCQQTTGQPIPVIEADVDIGSLTRLPLPEPEKSIQTIQNPVTIVPGKPDC